MYTSKTAGLFIRSMKQNPNINYIILTLIINNKIGCP